MRFRFSWLRHPLWIHHEDELQDRKRLSILLLSKHARQPAQMVRDPVFQALATRRELEIRTARILRTSSESTLALPPPYDHRAEPRLDERGSKAQIHLQIKGTTDRATEIIDTFPISVIRSIPRKLLPLDGWVGFLPGRLAEAVLLGISVASIKRHQRDWSE
jgi:hypothetical protein